MNIEDALKLYHFTRFDAFRQIMTDRKIRPSRALMPDRSMAQMISLTTDPDGLLGHGLPDGRLLASSDRKHHQTFQVVEGDTYLFDATVVRLGVFIGKNDPKLISALDLYKNAHDILDGLECAGYFPHRKVTDADIQSVKQAFQIGKAIRRGDTWFYYQGGLPFNGEDVAFRGADDAYFYLPTMSNDAIKK